MQTTRPVRPALILALVVVSQLMIVLDNTVVNLALPSIADDLGFSPTNLAWVSNAYILAFGGLLLLGGRLGDVLGRRRVFATGLALFTVASFAGGAASGETLLIVARTIQGAGAAIAAPSALALLLATFEEGTARNKALGLFFGMSAAGGAVGLLLGGVLTTSLSWRWVLWINVAPGIAIVALSALLIPETSRVPHRFDLAGTLTSTLGVASLVYGFIQAGAEGWTDGLTMAAFGIAVVLLGAFVVIETRAAQPLLPLRLFKRRLTSSAYLAMMTVPAVMVAMYYFTAQFMQTVLGYSAIETGLAFLPMSVLIFTGSRTVPKVLPRVGPRPLLITGALVLTIAMAWLTQLSASSSYLTALAGPLVLFGLGGGMLYMPLSSIVLAGVPHDDAGAASGAMQMVQQVGAALGIAVLVSVFGSALRSSEQVTPVAFASAASQAYLAGVGFAAVALLLTVFALRPGQADRRQVGDRRPDSTTSASDFLREWQDFRSTWEQFLRQPHGWLAAVSLDWLDETPRNYRGVPGLWWQDNEAAYVDPQGATMSYDGEVFTTVRRIATGDGSDEVRIVAGDVEVGITYRESYLLVVYDPQAETRRGFRGVPTYRPDPAWVLNGRFEPYAKTESISLDSVAWRSHNYDSPGVIRFEYDGTEHTLVALNGHAGQLSLVFTDATSGVTTYGACRSLDVAAPDEDGAVTLDFNRAVNLPCAFTDNFPICPVPPAGNRLPFAVEAGEKLPNERAQQHLSAR
jgi:EmrB/QacA subfamily drug resistance transporter